MFKTYRFVYGLIVCIFIANLWLIFSVRMHPQQPPAIATPTKTDYSGGVPIQRSRIEKYISKVADRDIDQLIADLNLYEALLEFSRNRCQDPMCELTFEACLANRSVAAIYEYLLQQNTEYASSLCKRVFDEKFQKLKSDWAQIFYEWETEGGCKKPVPVIEDYQATSAALFLVAAFCSSEILMNCTDDWVNYSEEARSRVLENPDLEPLLNECQMRACIEPLFLLNLFFWHLTERHHLGSIASLCAQLEIASIPESQIPFVAWDGHTNASDFTHNHANVPIDKAKTLRTFNVVRSWYAAGLVSDKDRVLVLEKVKRRLEKEIAS